MLTLILRKHHGVWDVDEKGNPRGLINDYFCNDPKSGQNVDFERDFHLPFIRKYISAIQNVNPKLFVYFEPLPNEDPPVFSPRDQFLENLVYSPHWYDLGSLFSKSFSGIMTHDVQGLARGTKTIIEATYFGVAGAKKNYEGQLRNIVRIGRSRVGNRPILIGECGIPMDINDKEVIFLMAIDMYILKYHLLGI